MRALWRCVSFAAWLAAAAYAQSWDALRELKPGDRVVVSERGGAEHAGTFVSFAPEAIAIETKRGAVSLERAHVAKVRVRSQARRGRNAAIGAAIGLAVGLTTDQTLGTYFRNESGESGAARAATYVAPIALFTAIPAMLPAYRTVYKAR